MAACGYEVWASVFIHLGGTDDRSLNIYQQVVVDKVEEEIQESGFPNGSSLNFIVV